MAGASTTAPLLTCSVSLKITSTQTPQITRWVNLGIYHLLGMPVPWEADPSQLAAEAGQVRMHCCQHQLPPAWQTPLAAFLTACMRQAVLATKPSPAARTCTHCSCWWTECVTMMPWNTSGSWQHTKRCAPLIPCCPCSKQACGSVSACSQRCAVRRSWRPLTHASTPSTHRSWAPVCGATRTLTGTPLAAACAACCLQQRPPLPPALIPSPSTHTVNTHR